MNNTEGKSWALVTGASSGIGYEIARKLDSEGFCTVLVARRRDALVKLQGVLKNASEICPADLNDTAQAMGVYQFCQEKGIVIDVLVNNAGFGYNGPFVEEPLDIVQSMIRVNILALATLTRLFLPDMMTRKKGHIVQISSAASFFAGPLMANYYATKAYVTSLSRALAYEAHSYGVAVTTICPGPVRTNFWQVAGASSSRLVKNKITTASHIANLVWKSIQKKRVLVVDGWLFSIMITLSRLLPLQFVTWLTALLNKTKPKISKRTS